MGKEIKLVKIAKNYGENSILRDIDLTIHAGERMVLLGPSGSGKSTLLRMIAGLEEITSGELYLGDTLANQKECGERNIAMVFQNYALYPHMTVENNITFSLKAAKVDKKEIEKRLSESLDMLGLTQFKNRFPKDLSGGQRQRTALARAVVKRSEFFLLDEPLSNLDVRLRLDARMELVKIHEKYQQTFVYVTHDQIEAMTLADRIVLLNEGNLQMVDTPKNVYNRPANVFTATFIGSPGMNILDSALDDDHIIVAQQRIALDLEWQKHLAATSISFFIGIRPEHIRISKKRGSLVGTIQYKELLGQNYALTIKSNNEKILVITEEENWKVEDTIYLDFPNEKLHFFSQETKINLDYPYTLNKGEMVDEIFTSI